MRNLRIVARDYLITPAGFTPSICAWDVSSASVVCVYGPRQDDPQLQLKRWQVEDVDCAAEELHVIASWDSPCPSPELDCDLVLDIHHLSDTKSVCLVLAGGDIVIVREAPVAGDEKIEIVGSADAGILAAAWSPDEELLALVSKSNTLIFMSRNFELVTEAGFSKRDLLLSKHVSVGWGKAETQFKGRGAKALRDPTIPEKVDEGLLSSKDDQTTTISWRGDGAYLAINSPWASSRRVIRIFSREGGLDAVSEPVDYLEASLTWRPVGNTIASVQRSPNDAKVVFFERNGLRHGEFRLRLSQEDAESWAASITLGWNCDSSVLAVCFLDRVQLWTMENYHYYLKQEIHLQCGTQSRSVQISWHPEDPHLCALLTQGTTSPRRRNIWTANHVSGGICRLEYAWRNCRSMTSAPFDYGVTAVVDGCKNLRVLASRTYGRANYTQLSSD